MITNDLVDRVSRMMLESDTGQLSELHRPITTAVRESKNFSRLLKSMGAIVVAGAFVDDDLSATAALLCLVEMGYKLKATEELEESFK